MRFQLVVDKNTLAAAVAVAVVEEVVEPGEVGSLDKPQGSWELGQQE